MLHNPSPHLSAQGGFRALSPDINIFLPLPGEWAARIRLALLYTVRAETIPARDVSAAFGHAVTRVSDALQAALEQCAVLGTIVAANVDCAARFTLAQLGVGTAVTFARQ